MAPPIIVKKKGLSPVWILPIVALCIGGWLLYKGIRDAGIKITVHFEDASGITPGKSLVMFRGIPVGVVRELRVDEDLQGINMIIEMKKGTKRRLVKDTRFWLVRPEVSVGRVRGLDTLLSGSYIGILPGKSQDPERIFEGLTEPPPVPENLPGLHLTLKAGALHSIQRGSSIYYKNIPVGSVQNYTLEDGGSVRISIFIEPKYKHLVKEGSRFWNASGISLSGNITGLKMRMESLAALARGGIAFETPEVLKNSPPAENGGEYTLYRDYEAAEYGIPMTLQLASGEGIVEGMTKVMYRGLKAGVVRKITINKDRDRSVTAHILLDPRTEIILRAGTRFWVVRPVVSIGGIRNIDTIIKGSYITFEPGKGPFQDHFVVEAEPPPLEMQRPGTHFVLVSDDSASIFVGAPVLYRKIKVGEVSSVNLDADGRRIDVDIYIYKPHIHLVGEESVFWNAGGIRFQADLSGVTAEIGTVRSILEGGIAFTTPPSGSKAPAQPGRSFVLHASYGDAVAAIPWLKPAGLCFILRTENLGSLEVGSPLFYKKMPVGEVTGFKLDGNKTDVLIDCRIKKPYMHLVKNNSRFYNLSGIHIEGGFSGISLRTGSLQSIVSGGVGLMTVEGGKPFSGKTVFKLYDSYDAALHADDVRIDVHFTESGGLKKGTPIRYRGIDIGDVSLIAFGKDRQTIVATARVKKEASGLFRDQTKLWLVKPEVGLGGVRNLDTVLTGLYIAIFPGEGNPRYTFEASRKPPPTPEEQAGISIILETARLGSLNVNSPVYYRQVQVGKVTGFSLSPTAQQVWVAVSIDKSYGALVRENTKFWNASGIRVEGGVFKGLRLSTESLQSLVSGGIAMATPGNKEMGKMVSSGWHFTLYDKPEKGWLTWRPTISLGKMSTKKHGS